MFEDLVNLVKIAQRSSAKDVHVLFVSSIACCWSVSLAANTRATCPTGVDGDTLGIRLPIDFAIFYQIAQSTSGTESYSEGFTLIASILHKIVSSTVSEQT